MWRKSRAEGSEEETKGSERREAGEVWGGGGEWLLSLDERKKKTEETSKHH